MSELVPLIRFDGVTLGYGREGVLSGVSCSVAPGDFVALVGPNGSGKTTFLRGVLGRLRPAKGRVAVDRRRRFAYVPQTGDLNLHWPMTVRDTVLLALRARHPFGRLSPAELSAAEEAMGRAGVNAIAERPLRAVSGGQRQRTVLAQALSQRPQVLLLDEPTAGLDVVAEREFLELIAELHQQDGLTVLFVTHALPLALNYARRIFLFREGSVIVTDPDELIRTKRLEHIYGIPFVHHEAGGLRWAAPAPEVVEGSDPSTI